MSREREALRRLVEAGQSARFDSPEGGIAWDDAEREARAALASAPPAEPLMTREEWRQRCDGSCDIALARRQIGPDGLVPGNAKECAEWWEREAHRLEMERRALEAESARLRGEVAEWKASASSRKIAAEEQCARASAALDATAATLEQSDAALGEALARAEQAESALAALRAPAQGTPAEEPTK